MKDIAVLKGNLGGVMLVVRAIWVGIETMPPSVIADCSIWPSRNLYDNLDFLVKTVNVGPMCVWELL